MISIKPYSKISYLGDIILDPFMRLLSGAPGEVAQRTHVWNLRALTTQEYSSLDPSRMVSVTGSYSGPHHRTKIHHLGLFHMPLLGGWKDYIVIEPVQYSGEWYIGFLRNDHHEKSEYISLIPVTGPVRMLKASEGIEVRFIGIDAGGNQIPIHIIGEGRIGDGKFSSLMLL